MYNLNGIQKWIDLECGFQPHLSASNINLFKNNLSMWILRYGYNKLTYSSPSMDRGTACELGIVSALTEKLTLKQATNQAIEYYNDQVHTDHDDHVKQVAYIEPIIKNAYDTLVEFGIPEFDEGDRQQKVEFELVDHEQNWVADIIGYLDLVYQDKGLVVDIKTTLRTPPVMSWSHQLQRAIYQTGKDNYSVKFLYVTPKASTFREDGDKSVLEQAKVYVNKMNYFCYTLSPSQAKRCIPLQDDFYFNGHQDLKEFYNGH